MRRSGVQPLDFLYTTSSPTLPTPKELIPDRRRLRSLVYRYINESSGDELVSFLLTPSRLERLEIRCVGYFPLPTLSSNIAPLRLRELAIWGCSPWPNHQFGSLTSLSLLCQEDLNASIYRLLDALRCSPHLEDLVLERDLRSSIGVLQPQEHNVPAVPLRSLKRLNVCRLPVETTRCLLGALDLPSNGIFMRFADVSSDLHAIFPETVAPDVSPRAATKVELIYPPEDGVIIHATNGIAYTRLTWLSRFSPPLITEERRGEYHLKELWLHINGNKYHRMLPLRALHDLERLVVKIDPKRSIDSVLFPMLSPTKNGVPSPLLSTLEVQGAYDVAAFGKVLKARSDAGSRLKMLRTGWFDGCEEMMAPLAQFVDNLDFYRVSDEKSRGLELPEECITRSLWWEPWHRRFVGEMETRQNLQRTYDMF